MWREIIHVCAVVCALPRPWYCAAIHVVRALVRLHVSSDTCGPGVRVDAGTPIVVDAANVNMKQPSACVCSAECKYILRPGGGSCSGACAAYPCFSVSMLLSICPSSFRLNIFLCLQGKDQRKIDTSTGSPQPRSWFLQTYGHLSSWKDSLPEPRGRMWKLDASGISRSYDQFKHMYTDPKTALIEWTLSAPVPDIPPIVSFGLAINFPPGSQHMTAAMIAASPDSRVQKKGDTALMCRWIIMELVGLGYVAIVTAPYLDQLGVDGVPFKRANILMRDPNQDPILSFVHLVSGYAIFFFSKYVAAPLVFLVFFRFCGEIVR